MNDKDQTRLSLMKLFPKQDFGLTERQDRLLALYACVDGRSLTPAEIKRWLSYDKAADRDADIEILKDRHLLGRVRFSWNGDISVYDSRFLRIALNALLYYPDVVQIVRDMRRIGDTDRFNLVQSVLAGENGSVGRLIGKMFWNNTDTLFADIVGEPAFDLVFASLAEDKLERLVGMRLTDAVAADSFDETLATELEDFAKKYMHGAGLVRTLAEIDGLRFLATGETRPAPAEAIKASEWPLATEAVRELYRGNYDAASELFENALKIRNKTAKIKNIFDSPILAYFLILSYILSNTDKTKKKLSQYLNKNFEDAGLYWAQAPARILAEQWDGMSEKYFTQEISYGLSSNGNTVSRILLGGIAVNHGLGVGSEIKKSSFAVVNHEAAALLGIDPKEKLRLESLFGGTSLISRIRVRKPWEIAIENLTALFGNAADKQDAAERKSRRIVYFLEYDKTVEIREQNTLKSGNWGQGKRLSTYSFVSGMYNDILDEYDRKVQERMRNPDSAMASWIFPVLVGCDRVFRGSYSPANKIEIIEEQPFIEVKLKNGEYVFTTNVPRNKYDTEYYPENTKKIDALHFAVIRLNRIQMQVLKQLSAANVTFPEEAGEALKAFITRLSGIIEVHSPLMESGSSLEERKGSTMLWLRIVPKSGSFDARLYVRPLENGKLTFFPGKGDSVCYDSDGTTRYQVTRSLRDEKAALKTFLERTGLDGVESDDGLYELAPEEMLPVVDAAKDLGNICTLEWPEGKSLRIRGTLEPGNVNINVRSKEQWFEIEGSAELPGEDALALEQILSAMASGGYGNGYLKLGEDDYVALSESLAKYLKRLEAVTQNSRGSERVSMFQVGALADIVRKGHLNAKADAEYGKRLARIDEAATYNPPVPAALKAEMRDYQEEGFRWMARLDHWGAGACLADDMGLGKTVQTIAFLLHKAASGASLVVSPASVLMNWTRELARFAPSLNVVVLNEQDDRTDALRGIGEYDVVLTTYGLLVREKEALSAVLWNVVCLDEAHTIKNRGTKMSDAAMSLKASSRVILTGTPVQNYLGELWNLFQFLNPGLLGSYESFHQKFIAPIENSEDKDRQSQLKRIIQPFMLRRTKSEVVEELPEKTEIYRSVPMSAAETVAYEAMRLEAKNELEQDTRVNMNALAAITRLREAACAMPLVKSGWSGEPTKLAALRELVGEIVSGGNGVLVFSQFTGFLDIVSHALDGDGVPHFYLQGSTPIKKRHEMVSGFQRAERPVFLISLKAGGLGLNLTGANYVIHLDPWWNPAIEQQATDRAYRIGQQQNVTVYHLIAQNSIEEKILRLHRSKQNLADAILEGTSKSHAITLDELRELLQ